MPEGLMTDPPLIAGESRTFVMCWHDAIVNRITIVFDYFQSILDTPWKPISRLAIAAWIIFYAWFLIYAFNAHGGGLFLDMVNLVIHEGGHNLFGWFGATLGLWGGTLLQLLVPFLLAGSFF